MSNSEPKSAELRRAALDYHEFPTPGKVAIAGTLSSSMLPERAQPYVHGASLRRRSDLTPRGSGAALAAAGLGGRASRWPAATGR